MSQGPFGLGRGSLGPAPACCAIVNVAPITVSASSNISTRLILVFMLIPSALPNLFPVSRRDGLFHPPRLSNFFELPSGIRIPLTSAIGRGGDPEAKRLAKLFTSASCLPRSEEHTSE